MKKLIFNYKRWYCKTLLTTNLLIPVFVLSSGLDSKNSLISFLATGSPLSPGVILATVFCLFTLTVGLIYTSKTFTSGKALRHHISWNKENLNNLMMGIVLHAFSFLILLSCVTFSITWKLKSTAGDFEVYKYVTFALSPLTLILGLVSNIYIHGFEFNNYFKVYYPRYKENDIKNALDGIKERQRIRQRALKS